MPIDDEEQFGVHDIAQGTVGVSGELLPLPRLDTGKSMHTGKGGHSESVG